MHKNVLLSLLVLGCASLFAQDKVRLNIKEGLWETTSTTKMAGMPPLPASVLEKMPPEQRAKMEAMMQQQGGGKGNTQVQKHCVTREKIDKSTLFDDKRSDCTHSVVSSTSNHLEVKFKCGSDKVTSEGTMLVDAAGAESSKGSFHVVSSGANGHEMTIDSTFTSRYLGAACGDVK